MDLGIDIGTSEVKVVLIARLGVWAAEGRVCVGVNEA